MARPQVADGEMASKMERSCEYIEKSCRGQMTRGDTSARDWATYLKLLTVKTGLVTKRMHVPRAWSDPLVGLKQWKRDMRVGIWNVRRLYKVRIN